MFPWAGGAITTRRGFAWGLENAGGAVGALLLVRDFANGRSYYPGYDGRGNVTLLVDTETLEKAAGVEYGSWGNVVRGTGEWRATPFLYNTKWSLDQETDAPGHWPVGLYDYGLRFYSPAMGRFLNRDPIREGGGPNLYQAFAGDPINKTDVLGLNPVEYEFSYIRDWNTSHISLDSGGYSSRYNLDSFKPVDTSSNWRFSFGLEPDFGFGLGGYGFGFSDPFRYSGSYGAVISYSDYYSEYHPIAIGSSIGLISQTEKPPTLNDPRGPTPSTSRSQKPPSNPGSAPSPPATVAQEKDALEALRDKILKELCATKRGREAVSYIGQTKGVYFYSDPGSIIGGYYQNPYKLDRPHTLNINIASDGGDPRILASYTVHEARHSSRRQSKWMSQLYGPGGLAELRDTDGIRKVKERMEFDAYLFQTEFDIEMGFYDPEFVTAHMNRMGQEIGYSPNRSAIRNHVRNKGIPDGSNEVSQGGDNLRINHPELTKIGGWLCP